MHLMRSFKAELPRFQYWQHAQEYIRDCFDSLVRLRYYNESIVQFHSVRELNFSAKRNILKSSFITVKYRI